MTLIELQPKHHDLPRPQQPHVSVIICAYTEERWHDLVAAVSSVQRQTKPPLEVIVAIDHNPTLTERVLREIEGVVVTENREVRGLSGARNSGIAAARGDVIAFMDEDAVAEPDWLEQLGSAYADAHVLGVGGTIEPWWVEGRPGWHPEEFAWVVGCTYHGMPSERSVVRNLIGCNMSMRREAFATVGGFRSGLGRIGTYPAGCEETEWCIRAQEALPQGYFVYEPRARVRHRVPGQRATWSYFCRRCYAEGISKALVSRLVGPGKGLAAERRYTTRILPQGVWQGLTEALTGRDTAALKRAGAIIVGLGLTTAGFLKGSISTWLEGTIDRRKGQQQRAITDPGGS